MIFRVLSDAETLEFQEHALHNDPLIMERWYIYHPVCRAVWLARGLQPPSDAQQCGPDILCIPYDDEVI